MKLKSIDTLDREEHELLGDLWPETIKRLRRLENFTPQELLSVCLAYPADEEGIDRLMYERNGHASKYSVLHLVTEADQCIAELVYPYIDFLMEGYDETQVSAAKQALIMFVSADMFQWEELSDEYRETLLAVEKALGYTR